MSKTNYINSISYVQKEGNSVKFKSYGNKLNNLIRKCKGEYYHKKIEKTKNNIRQTWKTINCVIGRCK